MNRILMALSTIQAGFSSLLLHSVNRTWVRPRPSKLIVSVSGSLFQMLAPDHGIRHSELADFTDVITSP